MDPLLEQFLGEARENLAFIEQNIEQIGGDDPELLNSVFRAAHTLKGGSGIVGFQSVQDITHHAEDLLDMLRGGRLAFEESMVDVLYDAFDEVLNLIEAAEESGGIVEADQERIDNIIASLNQQMGKDTLSSEEKWEVPFILSEKQDEILNKRLSVLNGTEFKKINFENTTMNQEFCENKNLYAIYFDVDESCMLYGNDPLYALSLLNIENILGIYTCMSNENAKSVLSGIEDEDGLLLKTSMTAYVYASFDEIEEALFNFMDEIEFVPLDILTLLSIDLGNSGYQIDSLKELNNISQESMPAICEEVTRSLELIGKDTLQHEQLQRFLDISGLIQESDIPKLDSFFKNLYKGQVYTKDIYLESQNTIADHEESALALSGSDENIHPKEMDESIKATIEEILEQQYKALEFVENEDDVTRVGHILNKIRAYMPEVPENFNSKDELKDFLETKIVLDSEVDRVEDKIPEVTKEQIESVNVQTTTEAEKKKIEPKKEEKKAVVGKTVKIEQESIDSLMDVVGELLVAKNSLPYLADNIFTMSYEVIRREIMEKYIFINRLSEQLQDLIMDMRMLPISYVFDRYPKLVRDISKKLGKKVKLDMSGGETKLDKNMIEMLADPMIHIMRNSLDHGIEMPEVRTNKGKEATGLVTLNAYAQSDKIIIKIVDDGAGINVEKVVNKVLEKGLMTHEEIDALSEDELSELVLLPGLSTAEEISEYSGRGVGMDVVKKSIESFGGTINISTKANIGTTITLSIPMSLAVTSLLHVQMNSIHYGIPMDSVSETVKIEKEDIEYLHNEAFIYIRGEVIPLLFIKSMLDEKSMENEPLSIVVLNIKENMLAVVVNEFLGQLDVVQKPLVGIMENHPLFSGTALLGNGQIIMSIDPIGLLSISQKLKESVEVA